MKGSVIGTEMRAFHNLAWHRGNTGNLIGLTGFGPNLNIARDPRFGRISELPGEDPYHSGTYGYHMIQGMQEKDENGHPKMLAYLKHFTAYVVVVLVSYHSLTRMLRTQVLDRIESWSRHVQHLHVRFLGYIPSSV